MIIKLVKKAEFEAVQWNGSNVDEVKEFCGKCTHFKNNDSFMIATEKGDRPAYLGDWIVKDGKTITIYSDYMKNQTFKDVESGVK